MPWPVLLGRESWFHLQTHATLHGTGLESTVSSRSGAAKLGGAIARATLATIPDGGQPAAHRPARIRHWGHQIRPPTPWIHRSRTVIADATKLDVLPWLLRLHGE
jgi:hypothetical protein